MPPRPILAATLALALAGCGEEGAKVRGGVSPGEAKALDDAAAMLEARRLPPEAIPTDAAPALPTPARAEMTNDAQPLAQ
jgi:hypothetical protein